MNKISHVFIIVFSLIITIGYGQFTVTQDSTANNLAQQLAGAGVTISNATLNCAVNSSGTFVNAPVGLGFSDGVVLSSGNVIDVGTDLGIAHPQSDFASTNTSWPGDPALMALYTSVGSSTTSSNDACALEFDIVVTGDSLKFNYAFGSEEYDEFVCNTYADIFAFFISGPNPAGGNYTNYNIALVPGTNIPVTVNTINKGPTTNPGSNPFCDTGNNAYFINQAAGGGVNGIVYDGMTGNNQSGTTVPLQAIAATVPCQSYHFKLVIGDGQDRSYDSGVFLEAGSFSSNAVVASASSILGNGFNDAVEGCVDGLFTLTIDTIYAIDIMVGYQIGGTATNGVDYAFLTDSVLVPAGDTVVDILVDVIADGIIEGSETVTLTPYTECGTLGNSVSLQIIDEYPHGITVADTTLCSPAVVTFVGSGAQYYSWSDSLLMVDPDSATTATINPVSQTTTFYMAGELGTCNFIDTVTIYVSQSNPTIHIDSISCAGANDGAFYIELNDSANRPFTYNNIFGANLTDSFNVNIGPGIQIASAIDAYGCTFSFPSLITSFFDPPAMTFSFDTISISCAGAADGDICVYGIADGTYTANIDTNGVLYGTYAFTILNSDTFCFGPFAPDTYDVNFTNDTLGCSGSFTTTIGNSANMCFSYDTTNITCAGDSDGSICVNNLIDGSYFANVSYNGGLPVQYPFTINSDTFCLASLPAGNYDINLTDNATFNVDFTVNLTEPDTLVVGINVMGSGLCAGGSIDSLVGLVTGGTTAYQYNWSNGMNTANISSIPYGSYTLIVTDDHGCIDSSSVTINAPVAMFLNLKQDSVLCFGGNSGIAYVDTVSGALPLTYVWSTIPVQNNDTATNLIAGSYSLTVTDVNNCSISDTVDVLEPLDSLSISLSSALITCFGGDTCIDATVSGGIAPYTYSWSVLGVVFATTEDVCNIVAGTYTLIVTDANGCTNTETITILENPEIILTKDSVNINCFGGNTGSATVNATGGSGTYTYLWDDALAQTTATANNLVAGNYTVIVADATDANCSKTISVNIVEPTSELTASLDNLVDVMCNGASTGEINVNISGGTTPYTYAWTNGSVNEDLQGVIANSYTLTVTDANGCDTTYSDIISQPLALTLVVDSSSNIACFGGNDGAIAISVSGGISPYTYAWNNSATTQDINNLTAGTYTVNVLDSNNCSISETVTIAEPSDVNITFNYSDYNGFNVSCNGSFNGTIEAVVATGGTAPFTYAWDNAMTGNPITGISANTPINVTVSDDNGCSYIQAISPLTEPTVLVVTKDSTNLECAGSLNGTATAIPSGGTPPYTYLWSDPSSQTTATATDLAPNTYTCNVIDANLCSSSISVRIEEPSPIIVTTSTDSVRCWGDADGIITISASGGNGNSFEFSIDGGISYQVGSVFTGLNAGAYNEIIVRQGGVNGCVTSAISAVVNQPDPMFIVINPEDTTIQLQESVPLNIIVDPATGYYSGSSYTTNDITNITWTPTVGLDCFDCLNPTVLTYNSLNQYDVTVLYSPYACVATATAIINVENNLRFFIPSGFSPQGDGLNDKFKVYGEALRDFHISVFNRWGEKVFESATQSKSWDGTFKGELQNPGVFTYFFEGVYLDGKEVSLKGSVTLIR